MNPETLFPYLVRELPDPEQADLAVPVGHGLFAVVYEDRDAGGPIVHTPVTRAALTAAGLTPAAAHTIALDNLVTFADNDDRLSIQILGGPGEAVHFLLYSDHPRAAACLRLPDLFAEAREHLGTSDLCAVVPQQESLVVFPKRDRAFRDALLAKLRAIEAGADAPLTFALFDLTPAGVRAFTEE